MLKAFLSIVCRCKSQKSSSVASLWQAEHSSGAFLRKVQWEILLLSHPLLSVIRYANPSKASEPGLALPLMAS